MEKESRKQIRKAAVILFWLTVWQAAAAWTDNQILLAGPLQVLDSFIENIMHPDFFPVILSSLTRIGAGFFLAFFAGAVLGAVSCRLSLVEELLSPVISVLKSIPVASFVVLLLIWFGSGRLSFFISFLIVFPNVYVNTVAGVRSTDAKLLEMAWVFEMGSGRKFFYLYRPALMPYLDSCLKISLGMSWKSGVAAEIIGLPQSSLGERLYMSKIYLDTAGLFAWTITIVLGSFLFEKGSSGFSESLHSGGRIRFPGRESAFAQVCALYEERDMDAYAREDMGVRARRGVSEMFLSEILWGTRMKSVESPGTIQAQRREEDRNRKSGCSILRKSMTESLCCRISI